MLFSMKTSIIAQVIIKFCVIWFRAEHDWERVWVDTIAESACLTILKEYDYRQSLSRCRFGGIISVSWIAT